MTGYIDMEFNGKLISVVGHGIENAEHLVSELAKYYDGHKIVKVKLVGHCFSQSGRSFPSLDSSLDVSELVGLTIRKPNKPKRINKKKDAARTMAFAFYEEMEAING